MIKPTVGRVVEFMPRGEQLMTVADQPCAALVARVLDDTHVNLVVFDADGHPWARTNTLLVQPEDTPPETGSYCRWMTYQQGQAAKTEDVTGKLTAQVNSLVEDIETLKIRFADLQASLTATPAVGGPLNVPVSPPAGNIDPASQGGG